MSEMSKEKGLKEIVEFQIYKSRKCANTGQQIVGQTLLLFPTYFQRTLHTHV